MAEIAEVGKAQRHVAPRGGDVTRVEARRRELVGAGGKRLVAYFVGEALESEGVEVLAFPVGTLIATFLISGVVGVLAAVWPAFRAGRLNVLRAIATE